jgi:hypothetical protein
MGFCRRSKTSMQLAIWLLLIISLSLSSCKKNSSPNNSGTGTGIGGGNDTAAITPVGTPTGTAISKSIGSAGGTLMSADGKLLLTIPAGALTVNTNITIQPVTSTMPGSLGLSYDLQPNGTKFAVPVTLTFHYDSTLAADKDPDFLFIAYQDGSGAWKGDATQRDIDTVAKTTTLSVSHFTIFDAGEWIFLKTGPNLTLQAEQTCDLSLVQSMATDANGSATVTSTQPFPDNQIAGWQVDNIAYGDALRGKITPSLGAHALYTAPSIILDRKVVFVEVITRTHEIIYRNGKVWLDINPVKKGVAITLLPYWEYNLRITYTVEDSAFSQMNPVQGSRLPDYKDYVVFDLNLKTNAFGVTETVTNIKNNPPTCVPSHYTTPLETWDWLADPIGEINVDSVVNQDHDEFPDDSVLSFYVKHVGAIIPGFLVTNNVNGSVNQSGPIPFTGGLGVPDVIDIDLKRKMPYLHQQGALGYYETIYVVPIE